MMTAKTNETHEHRIARLETSVATLAEGMSHLTMGQEVLRKETREGFAEMKRYDAERASSAQWTIGKLSAIVGSVLLVGGALLAPYIGRQTENTAQVDALKAQMVQHMIDNAKMDAVQNERWRLQDLKGQ